MQRALSLAGALLTICTLATAAAPTTVPTPEEAFGFRPGSDRHLVDYEQLTSYLKVLADASPRVAMEEIGRSTMDRPMYVVFFSTEENIARLPELREVNRRLALEPALTAKEVDGLVQRGRVFLMAMLSMHSSEVAPAQALPLLAYELTTTDDPALLQEMRDVVLMVVPTHNPDGMDMVVEHYRDTVGTPYEGSRLPGVYHRYVGHDDNRDYLMLTQAESLVVNRLYSAQWFPQVVVDKHQMGQTGPRYFVPPYHDPISENLDEGLWSWNAVFGADLANDMTGAGLAGVVSHWGFDEYWPGAATTSHWKGAITLLTEAASCRLATPVFVEPTELKVWGKGLAEYAKSVNMPDPWRGGWWRLGDIVRYELASMHSLLDTSSRNREQILRFRNQLCRKEVEKGRSEPPYYFVFPRAQHDRGALADLSRLLGEHGVEQFVLSETVQLDGRVLEAGDLVVPLAQPFRTFVKETLEPQEYPVRHYTPGGEVIEPYDVTSWSLPLHMGLDYQEVRTRSPELEAHLEPVGDDAFAVPERVLAPDTWGLAYPATDNDGFRAAFAALAGKLDVARLEEAAEAGGVKLEAGSFIIHGPAQELSRVEAAANVSAVVLRQAPQAPEVSLHAPRIGLIETYFHDMDAGWTRWLFDTWGIPYRVIHPGELGSIDLGRELDVLVFPSADPELLTKGVRTGRDGHARPSELPPQYRRPISKEGLRHLAGFIEGGGVVVSWGRSPALFLDGLPLAGKDGEEEPAEKLELPAEDVAKELRTKGLYVPGSWLAVKLTPGNPLTWGMPSSGGIFSEAAGVFETSIPFLDTDRRVIASHPAEHIVLSGYAEHPELLASKAVMVWLRAGKGQLVLMGFNPQFRGSTPATFKLLFNALLLPPPEGA